MGSADFVGVWNGARREMELEGWHLVRSLKDTKAMREASTVYTPQTERERKHPDRYQRRLDRSALFPAYRTTVEYIAALPFQKEPTIDGILPDQMVKLEDDADRCGTSLSSFWQMIYFDAIDRGVGYALVDNVPAHGMTLLEADAIDARPYFCRIAPDNVIGWQTKTIAGRDVVTEFRYHEWTYQPDASGFDSLMDTVVVWTPTTVERWRRETGNRTPDREMLAANQGMGGYQQVSVVDHGFPGGIPLVALYTERVAMLQGVPPLRDLAWQNVAHWNAQSMQDEALHYGRAPILKVSGVSSETAESKPELGPGAAIVDTGDSMDVAFVEIAGTSLAAGEVQISKIEQRMAALGMKPLVAAGGPATATGEVRADMQEKSRAQSWVETLEWCIYRAYGYAAKWLGVELPNDFDVTLFKDSSLIAGKATDLPVLQSMATAGQITLGTFLSEVKARGVLVTVDDVAAEVEAVTIEKETSQQRQLDIMAAKMVADRPQQDGQQDNGTQGGSDTQQPAAGEGQ